MEDRYVIVEDNSYYEKGIIVADCNESKFVKLVSDIDGITLFSQQLEIVDEDYKVIDFMFDKNDSLFGVFSQLRDMAEIREKDARNNIHAISFYGDENSVTLSMSQNLDLTVGDNKKLRMIPIKVFIDASNPNYGMFLNAYNSLSVKTNHEPIRQIVKVNRKD